MEQREALIGAIGEVCRLLDIRAENVQKAESKGAFERTPALGTLLKEADGGIASLIHQHQIETGWISEAYASRAGRRMTESEVIAALDEILKSHPQ